MGDEKIVVFKLRPKGGGEWLMVEDILDYREMLDEAKGGDEFELVCVEMTRDEIDALGDFGGW